jgi:hypothetical protein
MHSLLLGRCRSILIRFGLEPGFVGGWAGSHLRLALRCPCNYLVVHVGCLEQPTKPVLGSGADEYKRVAAASLVVVRHVAIVSYVLRFDTASGYVGLALPVGLLGCCLAGG